MFGPKDEDNKHQNDGAAFQDDVNSLFEPEDDDEECDD